MSDEQQHTTASAQPRSERTPPQGTRFDTDTLRDYIRGSLRSALRHPAVSDQLNQQLKDRIDGKFTTDDLTAKLRPIVTDALDAATDADWAAVCRDFLTDAESVLGLSWPELAEKDRWLIDALEQQLRESRQNADQLRYRARKLRAEAELHSDLPAMRDAELVLADRCERAADARPIPEPHPWPELSEHERGLIERIEQRFLEPTESREQLLARARELRAQAEQPETERTKREVELALADRYEYAAGTDVGNKPHSAL